MEKITVSYKKMVNVDNGTVYSQTVKIPLRDIGYINYKIEVAMSNGHKEVDTNKLQFLHTVTAFDLNETTLTTSRFIKHLLANRSYDVSRFKDDRNTLVIFE